MELLTKLFDPTFYKAIFYSNNKMIAIKSNSVAIYVIIGDKFKKMEYFWL